MPEAEAVVEGITNVPLLHIVTTGILNARSRSITTARVTSKREKRPPISMDRYGADGGAGAAAAAMEVYVCRRKHLSQLLAVRFSRNEELLWMLAMIKIASKPRARKRDTDSQAFDTRSYTSGHYAFAHISMH
ncbi:hypothetical protein BELL_0693g00030 [Botrytis elliptica]|uniref:Uncharacterized protein n=1 Tax=Botrytis elliptica TaxID=278938 RepID=A0A4Z1JAP8_9HELO|nr:hypothetical protein EAE99_009777 [Botrytis elliptica]TGO70628.1 hypothetical protein BELL_0693g00030 [Botrytis elliptica]